jgi:hypothetical protein
LAAVHRLGAGHAAGERSMNTRSFARLSLTFTVLVSAALPALGAIMRRAI